MSSGEVSDDGARFSRLWNTWLSLFNNSVACQVILSKQAGMLSQLMSIIEARDSLIANLRREVFFLEEQLRVTQSLSKETSTSRSTRGLSTVSRTTDRSSSQRLGLPNDKSNNDAMLEKTTRNKMKNQERCIRALETENAKLRSSNVSLSNLVRSLQESRDRRSKNLLLNDSFPALIPINSQCLTINNSLYIVWRNQETPPSSSDTRVSSSHLQIQRQTPISIFQKKEKTPCRHHSSRLLRKMDRFNKSLSCLFKELSSSLIRLKDSILNRQSSYIQREFLQTSELLTRLLELSLPMP